MNDYRLFNYENVNQVNNVGEYYNINSYKTDELFKGIGDLKPIEEVPDVLHRDDFMEQDIEIDISSNKFRDIWNKYSDKYNTKINESHEVSKVLDAKKNDLEEDKALDSRLDKFYEKAEEFNNYLMNLSEIRKETEEEKQLLDLSKKELEQEKELLNIEKDNFEKYKKEETEKLNRDKLRFQNMVEEIKNKIDNILK